MARIETRLLYAAIIFAAAISTAQAATVKEVFQQHDLLGTFAPDCTKPASKRNFYDVHRAIDSNHVQREQMSGPTTRDFVVIFEQAAEVGPNEIAMRGTRNGQLTDSVYRVEPGRMRVIEGVIGNKTVVTGGRLVNGGEMPWVYKCNGTGTQARTDGGSVQSIFEKHGLLGTFASDCSKPASPSNLYFVNTVLNANHVQRTQMSSPTKRDAVTIIDRAQEQGSNEIHVSGTRNDQPTEGTWRIEQNRQRGMEVTIAGNKVISGGRYVNNGQEARWLYKCAQTGAQSPQ